MSLEQENQLLTGQWVNSNMVGVPNFFTSQKYTNNPMKIEVLKLRKDANLPVRAHPNDAGADMQACFDPQDEEGNDTRIVVVPGATVKVPTGIAIKVPVGFMGMLAPRSSQRSRSIGCVGVGIIDSDYRGEIVALIHNASNTNYTIYPGDKIAQLVIVPVQLPEFVDVWNDTKRGEGGFGSTGK